MLWWWYLFIFCYTDDFYACFWEREKEKDSSLNENIPLFNWISRLDNRKGLSIGIRECEQPPLWMWKCAWLVWFDKTVKMYSDGRLKYINHETANTEPQHAKIKPPSFAPIPYFFVYVIFLLICLCFCLLPSASLNMSAYISWNSLDFPTRSVQKKMWKGPQIPTGSDHTVYSPVYMSTHTNKQTILWSHFSVNSK